MDIEAEMAKLQAEARRELDAREAAEPKPDLAPAEPAHLAREPKSAAKSDPMAELEAMKAKLAAEVAVDVGKGLASKAATTAASKAASASLGTQIALVFAALIGAIVAWKLIVKPLLSLALVIGAVLALVWLVAKVMGSGKDKDEPGE